MCCYVRRRSVREKKSTLFVARQAAGAFDFVDSNYQEKREGEGGGALFKCVMYCTCDCTYVL